MATFEELRKKAIDGATEYRMELLKRMLQEVEVRARATEMVNLAIEYARKSRDRHNRPSRIDTMKVFLKQADIPLETVDELVDVLLKEKGG